MKDKIVLEYSMVQKAFHRSSIEDMLKTNITNISRDADTGYMPIGIFDTYEQSDIFLEKFKTLLPKG